MMINKIVSEDNNFIIMLNAGSKGDISTYGLMTGCIG